MKKNFMMLFIVLANLFCLTLANPFHKYPHVFLLDIGNEEIEKVTTDQIRISAPGGSIALRYPAIGSGDDIAHVRVSGIDFGTDLRANIVEGGPGYNYVVLVLMGNEGTPYDAVISIQTVPNDIKSNLQILSDNIEEVDEVDSGEELNYSVIEDNNDAEEAHISEIDENNSAEDLNDSELGEDTSPISDDVEVVQETSNIYDYVQNEESKTNADLSNKQNDGGVQIDHQDEPSYIRQDDVSVDDRKDEVESLNEVKNDDNEDPSYIKQPEADVYYVNDNSNNVSERVLDKELLEQYLALRARIFGNTVYDQTLPVQMEIDGNIPKNYDEYIVPRKDVNNSFIDRNGNFAVAY